MPSSAVFEQETCVDKNKNVISECFIFPVDCIKEREEEPVL
jgi:hypothetical protein